MLPRLALCSLALGAVLAALAAPARAQFGSEQLIGTGGYSARDAQAADLDGDGDADVLAASWGPPALDWFENLGGGAFGPSQPFVWFPEDLPLHRVHAMRALDHDDDGDLDVFACAEHYSELGSWNRVEWWRNLGGGSFEPVEILASMAGEATSLRLADLEDDGDLDLVWAEWGNEAVKAIKNLPGGDLSASIKLVSIKSPSQMQPGDLDMDGDADVTVASYPSDKVIRFENRDGDTKFGLELTVDANTNGPFAVNLSDLDGDGLAEIFTTRSVGWDKAVTLYANTGSGFGAPQVISTIGSPTSRLQGSDVDGDGDTDLLVTEFFGASWYLNDGAGNLGGRQPITESLVNVAVAEPADLNGDGATDVLVAWDPGAAVRFCWFENIAGEPWPWTELGSGLAGVAGVPQLSGLGTLAAGSPGSLGLWAAAPLKLVLLFVSPTSTPAPFKGGTLVPVPVVATLALGTSGGGSMLLTWTAWPAGLGGQSLFFQCALQDAAAVQGVALSEALRADVP